MSIDYFVYLKHADRFSSHDFEQYCNSFGLQVELHPSFNLLEDTGFSPIRLIDKRFADHNQNYDFLSGFEVYPSEYEHDVQPQIKPTGFFQKLFRKKPAQETPFDIAIKDAAWHIMLACHSGDSFEMLLAYIFGAYLVKHCSGVFDDPQTGQFYDDHKHLECEVTAFIEILLEQRKNSELLTHEFTGWT